MGRILNTVVIVLLIIWLVGYFGFKTGDLIHLLLAVAIIIVLLRVISGRSL